jgi:hypothetical protein
MSTRFGDGGYGDKNYAPFNLNTCQSKDQKDCTPYDPDAGKGQWRFILTILTSQDFNFWAQYFWARLLFFLLPWDLFDGQTAQLN